MNNKVVKLLLCNSSSIIAEAKEVSVSISTYAFLHSLYSGIVSASALAVAMLLSVWDSRLRRESHYMLRLFSLLVTECIGIY